MKQEKNRAIEENVQSDVVIKILMNSVLASMQFEHEF